MTDNLTYAQWTALRVLRTKAGLLSQGDWKDVEDRGWAIDGDLTPDGEAVYQASYERYRHQRPQRQTIARR